ncbi:MAG TPA: universal stress protein [Nocardioidaceae bacterium]|nr:universal stress protein [Nocardioidaceae bacterium]
MNVAMQNPVVVGVDGSEQSLNAVRYAVQEAQRHGSPLRLVHVAPETVPMAPMLPLVSVETLDQVSHRIINEAKVLADDITDLRTQVEKVISSGSRVRALVESAEGARMIVLGHRDRSVLGRVFTSSTSTGVAARAHCPVISVPERWTPGDENGRVVVGIEGPVHAQEALAVAFAAASERNAALRILHAWKLESPYDDIVSSRVAVEQWRRTATAMLEEILHEWRELYPEVKVEIDVVHRATGPALVDATRAADLLVLGRRGHRAPLGLHLGSVARTLIREAHCPVVIAPARTDLELVSSERWASEAEVTPET